MSAYFQYLGAMIVEFFKNFGAFFAAGWKLVPAQTERYNTIFKTYSGDFGAGGWVMWVVFLLLFIGVLGANGFGL